MFAILKYAYAQKYIVHYSILKMEAIFSYETLVFAYKSTPCSTQKTNTDIFTAG
jgi:hypothetical protein